MQVNDYRERLKSSEEELQVGVFIPNLNVQKKNNLRGEKKRIVLENVTITILFCLSMN